jgi:hypothetical protein
MSAGRKQARDLLALIALSVMPYGALGCGGFDHLEFSYRSASVDNQTVSFNEIRIHEGIAVGVIATPMDGNDPMAKGTKVELASEDSGVLGVAPASPKEPLEKGEANWNFVIFGVKPGRTYVNVDINGEGQGRIPAEVEPQ